MTEKLPPVDPELAEAFAAEQDGAARDPDLRNQVWNRLELALALGPPPVPPAAPATPAPETGATGGSAAGQSAAVGSIAGTTLGSVKGLGIVGLAVALGAGGTALYYQSNPVVVVRPAVSASASPSASAAALEPALSAVSSEPPPSSATAIAASVVSAAASGVVSAAPSGSMSRDAMLAEERVMIDTARAALGRGEAAGALRALDKHAATFPRGRLSEEREALTIQALAAAGRTSEARARGKQFLAARPNSLFAPAIEKVIGSIP